MDKLHLSDETLMAYADGELPQDVAAAVEASMRSDASLVKRVVGFVASRRLARSSTIAAGLPEVPAPLAASVKRLQARHEIPALAPGAKRSGRRRVPLLRFVTPALAAGLAAVGIYLVTDRVWTGTPSATTASSLARPLADGATPALVASLPTGAERAVSGGSLRLIATYRSKLAGLCREFELDGARLTYDGVACRDADGWSLRFLAARGDRASYSTADGTSPVARYLDGLEAGSPLDAAAEKAALAEP